MYLIAIAWMYVVLMMVLAEALSPQGTLLGALITLVFYGLLPLSVVLYVAGSPLRRRARRAAEAAEAVAAAAASTETGPAAGTAPAITPPGSASPVPAVGQEHQDHRS